MSDTEIDADCVDDPTCPYCGHKEHDSWEMDFGPGLEGDTEITCDNCEKTYRCERQVSVYYTSYKKDT